MKNHMKPYQADALIKKNKKVMLYNTWFNETIIGKIISRDRTSITMLFDDETTGVFSRDELIQLKVPIT